MSHETDEPTPVVAAEVEALKCADCARAESADHTAVPVDRMPIPVDALAGFPDGVPRTRGLDRRAFLRNGVLGFASVYAATKIDWTRVFETAIADGADPGAQLVMIYLNGGMDGLNAAVPSDPAAYAAYQTARPALSRALATASVPGRVGSTTVPNADVAFANPLVSGTGNNGDTKGFDTLWGDGTGGPGSDLAYFPGVHLLPATGSHFEATDHIFAGSLRKLTTGWLGRWLDAYGSTTNPLQAVSIGGTLSKQIRSAVAPTCSVASLGNFGFTVGGVAAADADVNAEVGRLTGVPAGTEALARSRGVYGLTVNVAGQLKTVPAPGANPDYPPNSSLSDRLKIAATLLSSSLGTRIVTIDWGSFDTHGQQLGGMDPQLPILSRALAAFRNDLVTRGIEQRVVTVVFTEFGRRVGENGSAGTDHGEGGPCFVMGSKVRGGMGSAHPSLTTLDRGNLVVATDYRTIWQSLVAEWLGGDPSLVVPEYSSPGIRRPDGALTLLK